MRAWGVRGSSSSNANAEWGEGSREQAERAPGEGGVAGARGVQWSGAVWKGMPANPLGVARRLSEIDASLRPQIKRACQKRTIW